MVHFGPIKKKCTNLGYSKGLLSLKKDLKIPYVHISFVYMLLYVPYI